MKNGQVWSFVVVVVVSFFQGGREGGTIVHFGLMTNS